MSDDDEIVDKAEKQRRAQRTSSAARRCPRCKRDGALSVIAVNGTTIVRCRWPDCGYEREDPEL